MIHDMQPAASTSLASTATEFSRRVSGAYWSYVVLRLAATLRAETLRVRHMRPHSSQMPSIGDTSLR